MYLYMSKKSIKAPTKNIDILTVSELNEQVQNMFKSVYDKPISLTGEITNLKLSGSHLYMTLKDNLATVSVVCWGFDKKFKDLKLENGNKIIIKGYVSFYKKSGNYQVVAFSFDLVGMGDLHKEYEDLKNMFNLKGYFDQERKKKLSELSENINKIGILTALNGAALKDFLYVLESKGFMGKIFVKGCVVQGINCAKSIVQGLKELDKLDLDIIILMRGGGSFEDLFGFSDKNVVKAIYKAKTLTISAIGHEIDFMLSDFVADIRAPTPSIAGEIIATHQNKKYNLEQYDYFLSIMHNDIITELYNYRDKINDMDNILKINNKRDIIDSIYDELNYTDDVMKKQLSDAINFYKYKIDTLTHKFIIANPQTTIKNGYCILFYRDEPVTDIQKLKNLKKLRGKKLKIQLLNGCAMINAKSLEIKEDNE